ncbi:hypothetical protein H4S04_004974 [Coemansia sp. S16]|nr:hypothetical protein H4S03_006131 [Coemansia sp. S3946]KAJ2042129.1 hypothetical protein GGI08_007820 [Coemansia sp. S2]KAJ2046550.1 hypothetical protein H4S04_004974 [Coemansia sp. S16]
MSASNTARHARAALMDIYRAERSWGGWNEDGVTIANDLVNLLLQMRNSQEPVNRQIDRMQTAADSMLKLLPLEDQEPQATPHLSVQFEEPFALGSLKWYAERALTVCDVYRQAVSMREEHIDVVDKTIDSFEGLCDAPSGALDSDTQLVYLSTWLHSPGLQNAKLMDTSSNSTLMLSDYDDMLRIELGIEKV